MVYIDIAIGLLDMEMELLTSVPREESEPFAISDEFAWTGKIIHLVELLYGACVDGNINSGDVKIHKFIVYIGRMLSVNVKNCYDTYGDIKKRKSENESRTYFLDRIALRLNQHLDREDEL